MFRLWGKIWKDNHLVQDAVAEEAGDDTRTHKVFHTLDELCREFVLAGRSGWNAISGSFQRHSKTRFHQDSFIEEIDFDYLEIQILEE